MSRSISLFSAARGSEVRTPFPTRDAAVQAVLSYELRTRDALDPIHPRPDRIEALIEGASELVDELVGSFENTDEARFMPVPATAPGDWMPADRLDVPPDCVIRWDASPEHLMTMTEALKWAASCNKVETSRLTIRNWWMAIELGDELDISQGYDVLMQGSAGVASLTSHYPVRVVTPTAEEKALVLAELEAKEAAEKLGQSDPIEKTDGRAPGHNDQKQPAKRPTLTQILRANGFDKFVGGELDERTQTFDLEFDVAGPWYVPAFDDRIDLEGILLALATDLEETARKFRKAAAEGLARPGDEEKGDKDDDDQLYRVVADGDVILDSLPRDVAEKIAASTNEARGREVAAVEPMVETGEPMAVVGGVA